jgi:hypothetical protein
LRSSCARLTLIAALVTLTAAIALDVAAGQQLLHTLPLVMAATVVAMVRVRLAGSIEGSSPL